MELLPLGSIVILKGGFKKLMIIGRKIVQGENKEFYDYLGCLYPEGDIGDEYKFVFNNKDVDKVIFRGYEDEEDEVFKKAIGGMKYIDI
ncbi:DUF4176 domain-containing protein [Sarcina ventriculi]|uniref:DUF4176 domain-containing protein n=1 Tax=Sarcina ventriculi TaxID=1267 RepID=UPI00073F1E89|nr:DUF4176 domain-containing protein [Sarcina ventriculi]MBU5322481.1 DUF4176 domain-containing protein [Sarcina ventriculi]